MSNVMLFKSVVAGAAIPAFTLVKHGADDATVLPAAASTDGIIGAVQDVSPAQGERCDVALVGIAYVTAGAAITRDALLTSDASGRAIAAAPAAGVNARTVGFALESASAAGDVIRVLLSQGSVQG